MKSFFWKFFWCIVPCLVAGWITYDAVSKYLNGDSGGFRVGNDLAGGTDLVYEIDLPKTRDTKSDTGFNPATQMNVLAEALKRRIDPNDLYNVVIRPVGEGRIEIVLPTGGTYRTKKAEDAWKKLLDEVTAYYFPGGTGGEPLDVPRGRTFELADRIQTMLSTGKWENTLFRNQPDDKEHLGDKAFAKLKIDAVEFWAALEPYRKELDQFDKSQNRLKDLSIWIVKTLHGKQGETTDQVVNSWVKKEAWEETMHRIRLHWPKLGLDDFKDQMNQILPDNVDQLVTFVQARGVLVGQAGINVLEPLTGGELPFADVSNAAEIEIPKREEVEKFIADDYGESAQAILRKIDKLTDKEGRGRDLNLEEVQRIKDLVAKVGALEFRILANSEDDSQGEKKAKEVLNSSDQAEQEKIKKAQETGAAPPAPTEQFEISMNGQKSIVRYEWIELGPQERRSLGLDNAARTEVGRDFAWKEAFFRSKSEKAFQIPDRQGSDKMILQGALFYRRDCLNRNLPDEERRRKEVEYFVLTRTPEYDLIDRNKQTPKIGGEYLTNAAVSISDTIAASFAFNNEGARLFGSITRKNIPSGQGDSQIKRHLAIILDDQVMSAPTINSVITNQGQITGNFTRKEVDSLVNVLRAGQLPATLKQQPVSETTMGATLGADTIQAGLIAVLVAFAAVLVFMVIYYQFAGLVASIALLANLLLTVGFMVGVQATFTLPGLAGLVLMLGMAVDANVLIYERLREERDRGAALPIAMRHAYERALPTIIDTHLSSIFTAIVLYVVGNDQLKGFGVSLTAGLIISLYTSLFMTRTIFDFWIKKGWYTNFNPFKLFSRPNIDFMRIRIPMFTATLTLAVLGLVLFIARLPDDLNIDFTGGTAYSGKLDDYVGVKELRDFFDDKAQKKWLAIPAGGVKEADDSDGHRFLVKYEGDDKGRVVNFANKPEGKTPEEREGAVRHRLSSFPDASVEQSFPSSMPPPPPEKAGKSTVFTVRTSEKEIEAVQTMLDQLLRTDNGPLLKKTLLKVDPLSSRETKLHFLDKNGAEVFASPNYLKSLFTRDLVKLFDVKDKKDLPVQFDFSPEGKENEDGSYQVVRLRFDTDLKPDQKVKVEQALAQTVATFEARPQPDRLENFDSQLATDTRFRAMWAILASWAAILLFLWFRFGSWTFGLAAVVCLIHDLFLTLGVIAAAHYLHGTFLGDLWKLDDFKIDLPSVAALLTLVGYSVNDTIVVFDRIREVRGKNPDLTSKMINDSVNQTLSRTILASLATWLVVFVLYVWGGPGVHLFAFVMVVGVVVGTYSSIYIAAPLLLMLGEGVKEPSKVSSTAIRPAIEGGKA
ncbi:MAG TPA: protein translocase subunit SecD [Gemmataceae bacterium]|nr:protein translocase subunit SecD [Gemmataceae bacterium]